jgi:hypothetical protein
LFPGDDEGDNMSQTSVDASTQLCVVLSEAAELGTESPKSMILWGQI